MVMLGDVKLRCYGCGEKFSESEKKNGAQKKMLFTAFFLERLISISKLKVQTAFEQVLFFGRVLMIEFIKE